MGAFALTGDRPVECEVATHQASREAVWPI